MSTRKNKQSLQQRNTGKKQGHVVRRDVGDGIYEIDIQVEGIPERSYTANVGALITKRSYVHIIFGQAKIDSEDLRSMLDIHFPLSAIHRFLNVAVKLEGAFAGRQIEKLTPVTVEPEETVALSANIITAGLSGDEAVMDYYYISPSAVHEVAQGGELSYEPIVRVNLPTGLMIAVIEELKLINQSSGTASQ